MQKVFISYTHKDEEFVSTLKAALEAADVGVTIDYEAVQFGDNLQEFLERSVQMTDFTISVISRHSLHSVWVIAEALETLMHEKVQAKKKFVPIFLDRDFFEPTFQGKLVSPTEQAIDRLREEIDDLSQKYLPTRALELEKDRLLNLRYHLDTILLKLRESLAGDFSSEQKFQENFPKLVQLIKTTVSGDSPPVSAFAALKRKTLETNLADLCAKYDAAQAQKRAALSEVDKITLTNQIQHLEQEIQAAQQELTSLDAGNDRSAIQ